MESKLFQFMSISTCLPLIRVQSSFRVYPCLQVSTAEKDAGIKPLDSIPIHGHINGIAMGPGGKFCVASVGQEPRMGRWDRVARAKNRFAIIKLQVSDDE